MLKFKKLWIIITLVFASLGAFGASVYYVSKDTQTTFAENGYVLLANANAESEKIYFNRDQRYSKSIQDGISFTDSDNNKRVIPSDSFFHLGNSYTMAMQPGVFMDLSESGNTYITHYQTQEGALFNKEGKYVLKSNNQGISFDEIVWKLNDNRYIILSSDITANFAEDDVRNCGDFVELNYLDRGVVQIITEDNIWQTVSSSMFLRTKGGIDIYPVEERIYNPELELNSFLNTLVVDSDDNMHLRNDQEANQIIPKFNVNAEDGKDGESGESGESGEGGEGGESGGKGSNGAWGADAGTSSTSKTDIPSMSIEMWNLTPTSLSGSIKVIDENEALSDNEYGTDFSVYIVEKGGNNKIELLPAQMTDAGISPLPITEFFKFSQDGPTYFTTGPDTLLKPDTEYNFVVSGRYRMGNYDTEGNGQENNMARDFIYRTFYTSSLGVMISEGNVTDESVSIEVFKNDYSIAQKATIFLLTEEQNKSFNAEIANQVVNDQITGYFKKPVTFDSSSSTKTVQFGGVINNAVDTYYGQINSNTKYIARLLINVDDSLTDLSNQKIEISTLKKAPTISGYPSVASNRQTKSFEIYGAKVNDPDKAIQKYKFDIYLSTGELVKTIEVSSADYSRVAYINLDIDDETIKFNKEYYLVETVVYNDNVKDVETKLNDNFNVLQSSNFYIVGTPLPTVSFRYYESSAGVSEAPTYDRIRGWIVITKNGADIKVDAEHPISIAIECEGVFSKIVAYSSGVTDNGTEILISIDENYLNQNKIYRMSVSACVDVNDDGDSSTDGSTQMLLGSVVVKTPQAPSLTAEWTATPNTTYTVSRTLKLKATSENDDLEYIKKTLSRVDLELYSGTTTSGTKIATVSLTDEDTNEYSSNLDYLFTTGIDISEGTFNVSSSTLNAAAYSILVSTAYDYTVFSQSPGNQNGYVNEIKINNNDSGTIGRTQQPPELPSYGHENECVTVVAITKKQAMEYYGMGDIFGSSLPEDTVVGYSLLAKYDDYGKLARKVQYFAFESNYFEETVQISNPERPEDYSLQDNRLINVTLDVDTQRGVIPSLVVWFGDAPTNYVINNETVTNGDAFKKANQYMVFAGAPQIGNNHLVSGMGRGFKYVFSYNMHYSRTGATEADALYPKDHPKYTAWNYNYGGKPILTLHSTVQSAPNIAPIFQSYPEKANSQVLTIKYRYEDLDGVLKYTNGSSASLTNTHFLLNNVQQSNYVEIPSCNLSDPVSGDSCPWQSATFSNISGVNAVRVTADAKQYKLDYSNTSTSGQTVDTNILVYETRWIGSTSSPPDVKITLDNSAQYTSLNRILVKVEPLTLNEVFTSKIVGVLLKFEYYRTDEYGNKVSDTNGGYIIDNRTKFISLSKEVDSYYGYILLGQFSDLLNKELTVSAEIVYDTDIFGWENILSDDINSAIRNNKYVALQKVSMDSGFGEYLSKDFASSTGSNPVSSLIAANSYYRLYKYNYDYNGTAIKSIRGLFYDLTYGVNIMNYTYTTLGYTPTNTPDIAIVPKVLDKTPVNSLSITNSIGSNTNIMKITSIIPAASYSSVKATLNSANIYGFQISGTSEIINEACEGSSETSCKYVYIDLYDAVNPTANPLETYKYHITGDTDPNTYGLTINLDRLSQDRRYYIEFRVKVKDGTSYTSKQLIDSNDALGGFLRAEFTTQGTVYVYSLNGSYESTAYKLKNYKLLFTLSQNVDIELQYYVDIKNSSGQFETLYNNQQLIDLGIITQGDNLSEMIITKVFDMTPGKYAFKPGNTYRFGVKVYSTVLFEDDNVTKKLVSSEDNHIVFTYGQRTEPASLINIAPVFEEGTNGSQNKYGLQASISAIGDDGYVVMSKYTPASGEQEETLADIGNYFIRLYEVGEGTDTLVEDDNLALECTVAGSTEGTTEITKLSQLYSRTFLSNQSITKLRITGLKADKQYKFVLYAAYDKDLNGKNDKLEGKAEYASYYRYSAANVINDPTALNLFNTDTVFKKSFELISQTGKTPDSTGITFGKINYKVNPNDNQQLQIVYFNSSNLTKIDKMVISVIHESGSPYIPPDNSIITDADGLDNMFVYDDATGRWNFFVPLTMIQLTKPGIYNITINHYVGDQLVNQDSNILEKN